MSALRNLAAAVREHRLPPEGLARVRDLVVRAQRVQPISTDVLLRVMTFEQFVEVISDWPEKMQRVALFERCRVDLAAFCVVYFPSVFGARFSPLHLDLLAYPKVPWQARTQPKRYALAAPRRNAKSTFRSFADVLHDIVYGFEAFIGMISTDYDLSEQLVKDLYGVFQDPDAYSRFHRDFGPFKVYGTQTDFRVVCASNPWQHGCRVRAYSIGGTCRGHTAPGRVRFTKWVIDDPVSPKRVDNPDIRDAEEKFIDDDVGESGSACTLTFLLGTRVHPDDLVSRKLDDPRWIGSKWQAVRAWPREIDGLWEDARKLWATLELGNAEEREAMVHAFYAANREAMDEGADVLWPEGDGIVGLMILFWSNPSTFFREKQNEPEAGLDTAFRADRIARCRWDPQNNEITTASSSGSRVIPLSACKVAIWWDPIPYKRAGRTVKGTGRDKAAIAVVARERKTGRRFVLEGWTERVAPDLQRAKLWQLYERFVGAAVGYEGNDGTNLDTDESFDRERRAHPYPMRPRRYINTEAKQGPDRIKRIQPDLCNHQFMEWSNHLPQAAWDQVREFPAGRNDDLLDAIERADWLLTATPTIQSGTIPERKPDGLR